MLAFNQRLKHRAKVVSINYSERKVQMEQPNSNPIFIYTEKLENIELLEDTGVIMNDSSVYVNDILTDGTKDYRVKKVPGGYYPFIIPNKKNFRRV